jgi:VanZ family protein
MEKRYEKIIQWFEKHDKFLWTITTIVALFIFYFSSLKFAPIQNQAINNLRSIIYHIGIFLVFSFFLLVSSIKRKRKDLLFLVVSITILYGILDEVHQIYVPGRSFALGDMLLDSLGILISLTFYLFLIYKKEKTSNILKT